MKNHQHSFNRNPSESEELHSYLQDLATMPVLSLKEEQDLVQQMITVPDSPEADAARTKLIEANLRLVVRLARRYQPFGLELADLVQEGNLALIKAAHQFDPQRSPRFRPFATRFVCWALYRMVKAHLNEKHGEEPDGEPLYPLRAQVLKALAHALLDEQACVFDLPEACCFSLTALLEEADSDAAYPDEHSSAHTLCSRELTPEEHILAQERRAELVACLQTLPRWERRVLTRRYLLGISHTREMVGRALGITPQRVWQIEEQGIRKLRHPRTSCILRDLL